MTGNRFLRTALVALAVLAMAGFALGQAQSGNIYGRVVSEDGSTLPGVTVTLTGGGPTLVTTTDSRGEFHFLNLAPGTSYGLKFELASFSTVDQKGISVNLGHNTDIRVTMKLTKVEAAIMVTGEAPLLDTKKVGTGATVTRNEMDMIPNARDPWVVMQTIPGVQIDRLNVGGNQSGQQSIFVAKGAQTTQGAWNLDGVTVSDMASGASSPTYWDFDAFQEMQVVTGGNDPAIATAGVTLNMVTKRGTNDVHGSARVFITDPAWQAHPALTEEMKAQSAAGGGSFVGSQITGIQDYGLEVGGPVLKDRLWLWGSYGRQQIDLLTVTNFPDKTTLEDINGKLNWQVLPSNALTGFYLRGDKRKFGRSASIQRPPPTTVDQKGPTALYKIEDNHVVNPSLVLDAFYSYLDEGFQLVPEGGLNAQTFRTSDNVYGGSFIAQYFKRPQHQVLGSVNYFFNTGSLGHEIKGGGSYRNTGITSQALWPGGGLFALKAGASGPGGQGTCSISGVLSDCGIILRPSKARTEVTYWSGYASDTITADRLTISAGLRYDDQRGTALATSVDANPTYPSILPAASAPARDGIHWQDVSPRFGVTYAIGEQRRTLARASYARYANQLGSYPNSSLSAIPGVAYAYYPWNDANKNNLIDPGELNTDPSALIKTLNYNPANPTSPVSVNSIDPNLKSQKTDEIVAGIGHEIFANFAVDLAYTYRHYKDFYFSYRSVDGTIPTYHLDHDAALRKDGSRVTLPDGTPVFAPVYVINGTLPPGVFFANRPDYTQEFNGVELTLNKRLSQGWMMRGSVAYNNAKQHVGPGACVDPNNKLYNSGEDSVPAACEDGGLLAPNAGGGSGSFGNVNLQAKWQFNVSGAYQLPLGFTVAGTFYGRQGYPIAFWIADSAVRDGGGRVYATAVDAYRYGWAHQLDLRLDKNIPITSTISATLAVDMFNVLNDIVITQRNSQLNVASKVNGTNTIFETQAPRIVRFSGRVSF